MQLLEAIFVAVESKSNDVFSSRELAELFGTTQKKFTDYTYHKGWLDICDNLDTELTALDCTFLIAQVVDSRVKWSNRKAVAEVFKAEPFKEIAESASVGSNSLRFRMKRKTDKAWKLEETVKANKTKIADNAKCIFANSKRISSLEAENAEIKSENAEIKADLAKIKAENAEFKFDNDELRAYNTKIVADNAKVMAENAKIKALNAELKAENAEIKGYNTELQGFNAELRGFNTELQADNAEIRTKLDAVLMAIKGSYVEFRENIDKAIDDNLNGQVAKFAKATVNKLAQPLDTIVDALVI